MNGVVIDSELLKKVYEVPGVFDGYTVHYVKHAKTHAEKILDKNESSILYDKEPILRKFLEEIRNEVAGLAAKVLVTVMHSEKKSGVLIGDSSEDRYKFFDTMLSDFAYVNEIYEFFPVLKKLVDNRVASRVEQFEQVLKQLNKDHREIVIKFDIVLDKLINLSFSGGDAHNGGKTVCIIGFSSGAKLVYKPHDMRIESVYDKIIGWMNQKALDGYSLKSSSVIGGKQYGWQLFVEHLPCENQKEVKGYYYRIGKLLALLHAIGAKDIHAENIIANKEQPVIIDLETLFSNDSPVNLGKHMSVDFMKHMNSSVFGTMLLPQKVVNAIIDVDLSGISGGGKEKSQKVKSNYIKHVRTDKMRFETEYIYMNNKENVVWFKGEEISALDYQSDMEQGFVNAMKILYSNREEFQTLLFDDVIREIKYRQVIRPTHVYAKYLEASLHPKYLTSDRARRQLFEMMYSGYKNNEVQLKRISKEIRALMRHDIPYFCGDFISTSLWGEGNFGIDNFFDHTLEHVILRQISGLCKDNTELQLNYVGKAMATLKSDVWHKSDRKISFGHKLFKDRMNIKENVKAVGEYFERTAIWNEDHTRCTWLTLTFSDKNTFMLAPCNHLMYEGGGIILFLAYLSEVLRDKHYADMARAGLTGMDEIYHFDGIKEPLSVFSGIGSLIYLYYNLSKVLKDDALYKKYSACVERLCRVVSESMNEMDIVGGLSGMIIMLSNIYKETEDRRLLQILRAYGEQLINALCEYKKNTGFAHGMSGYALAQMVIWHLTGDDRYLQSYRQLLKEENRYYNTLTSNWKDLREDSDRDLVYWCHGAGGVALSRYLMSRICHIEDISSIAADLDTAALKLINDGFEPHMNHSLCHGKFGNLDILLSIKNEQTYTVVDDDFEMLVSKTIEEAYKNGLFYGVDDVKELSGYMLGLSGIGMTLLRLMDKRVPSLLALEVWKGM